jgi:hypothetical protein
MSKTFYVCSYGGSGSWLLVNHLKKFGTSHHIHTRKPSNKLCEVDGEHFTNKHVDDLTNHHVVFIYSEPEYSIHCNDSFSERHWINIGVDPKIISSREDYVRDGIDKVKYEEFFDNYYKLKERNYDIVFIRFEKMWSNLNKIEQFLNVSFDGFPENKYRDTPKKIPKMPIYNNFRDRINNMESVFRV